MTSNADRSPPLRVELPVRPHPRDALFATAGVGPDSPGHGRFPRLLSPITINGVTLRNRIAVSAHWGGWFAEDGGLPSTRYADYIEHRAAGGLGLFVVGATVPQWAGGPEWIQNTSQTAGEIEPRYAMLAEAAHRHGTKLFAQLLYIHDPKQHGDEPWRIRVGMHAQHAHPDRVHPWPPERTPAELRQLAKDFGSAARRALDGGVDGLELHGHEGFLMAQFLSPRTNRRTDDYGGSLANRARLLIETLTAMREAVGPDVPLGVRLKATDDEAGGLTADDYVELTQRLTELNLVDYLNLTGGDGGGHHGPMARPDGEWLPLVARIKAATHLPVMHAGRVTTPELAEAALTDGTLDVVCMTKAHIAEPRLTQRIYEDRLDAARLCTRCLQNCIGDMERMTCVYNPVTGRERAWGNLEPAAVRKRVLIVGGGPAGCEAALIAAQRGHDVMLWERGERLGGQVNVAAAAPMRKMFGRISAFYQRQADAGAFAVEYGKAATADDLLASDADEIVIATGSRPVVADVPGAAEVGGVWTPSDVLAGRVTAEGHTLIVDRRGAFHAMLAADRLTEAGVAVTFVTPLKAPGWGNEGMTREDWVARLTGRGVRFVAEADLTHMTADVAHVRARFASRPEPIDGVRHLVVSEATVSENALSLALAAAGRDAHTIGDAARPAYVFDATMGANVLARSL